MQTDDVLCGHTYPCRLWCIWELFTLLAFSDIGVVVDRLQLIPLATGQCEELAEFKLSSARCFDPNEEAKLRAVIGSVGIDVFEGRVRMLATAALNKLVPHGKTCVPHNEGHRVVGKQIEATVPIPSVIADPQEKLQEVEPFDAVTPQ